MQINKKKLINQNFITLKLHFYRIIICLLINIMIIYRDNFHKNKFRSI